MRLHFSPKYPVFAAALDWLRIGASQFLTVLWGGSLKQYQPERHYMRGPGPKWREKHALEGTAPSRGGR
jgi:hypothetical protein